MKILSTRLHAVLDYLVGLIALVLPFLLGFESGVARVVLPLAGAALIAYSLLTEYEWGVFRILPLPMHLALDIGSGITLMVLPFIFGFTHTATAVYLVIGVMELASGLLTRSRPRDPEQLEYHRATSADPR